MLYFPDGQVYPGEEDEDHSTPEFKIRICMSVYEGHFEKGRFTGRILNPLLLGGFKRSMEIFEDGKWDGSIEVSFPTAEDFYKTHYL